MRGSDREVTRDETALFEALRHAVAVHSEKLTFLQMLAIFSQMTGAILACNDPRVTPPDVLSETVTRNMGLGLKNLIEQAAKEDDE
jgi:hypothetical protein